MKLDTGTKLPAQFQLTKEFEELFELIEQEHSYAAKLKSKLVGIQTNELEDNHNWRYKV